MKGNAKTNYLYNIIYIFFGILIQLALAPYLARILGASGVGTYAYCYTIAEYFVLFAKLGLSNYGTREIAKIKDKEKKSEMFSNLLFLQILSTIIVSIVYILYLLIFVNKENLIISLLFFIWIMFSFLDVDWFWSGEEEFKRISIRNMIIKIISTIMVFLIIKNKNDINIYALITIIGLVCGYACSWIGIMKKINFKKVNFNELKKHIIPCVIMLIPVVSLQLYRSMDKVMLGIISGMSATGIYENGEKLIYCMTSFISSLGIVMMPKMSYLFEKNEKEQIDKYISLSIKLMIAMTSCMSFGLMSISTEAISILFGNEFAASSKVLFLCSPTLIFIGWSNIIRMLYIIPNKFDKIYIKSILYGGIINLIINSLLIAKYGPLGAVIGTICAELFVPIYQYYKLNQNLPYKKYISSVSIYIVIGLAMFVILSSVNFLPISLPLKLITKLFVGGVIYIGSSILYITTRDRELFDYIKDLLKKRG